MTTEVAKVVEQKRKRSFEDSASVRTSRRLQGKCATVLGAKVEFLNSEELGCYWFEMLDEYFVDLSI